jgi:ankyrin repeat protein
MSDNLQQNRPFEWCNILNKHSGFNKTIKFAKLYGVNTQDKNGNTLLHLCDDYAIISWLLNNGADPNIKNNKGYVALQPCRHYCYDTGTRTRSLFTVSLRKLYLSQLLLLHGADPNLIKCPDYISWDDASIIKLLEKHGLDMDLPNNDGKTISTKLSDLYNCWGLCTSTLQKELDK